MRQFISKCLPLLLALWLVPTVGTADDAVTIADWNFENSDDVSATWFSTGGAPQIAPDSCAGESADYQLTALSTNRYWQLCTGYNNKVLRIENTDANAITDYTDASQHNVYFEASFPTTGYENISVNFAIAYGGNTAVPVKVVVSTDGGSTWIAAGEVTTAAYWWVWDAQTVSISAANKESVKVRLIGGNDYASNWNLDYLTVTGTVSEAGTAVSASGFTATWPFDLGTNNETNATTSVANVMSVASMSVGSKLSQAGIRNIDSESYTLIQPAENMSDLTDDNAMTFTLTPKRGLTLTPSSFSLKASRVGTGYGNVDIIAIADGVSYTLLEDGAPYRDGGGGEANYTTFTVDLSGIPATTSGIVIKVYQTAVASNKQTAFRDFIFTGDVEGTIEAVPTYTLATSVSDASAGNVTISPAGSEFDEETSITVSASENFGYHFEQWIDADGNVVSTENPYTFAITANTELQAVYSSKNVYALNLTLTNGARTNLLTVEPTGNLVDGVHYYEEGTQVKLTAINNKILTFTNWEDNTTDQERTVTMDGEKDVTANFSACDYIVAWDLYDMTLRQDRAADYASDSENQGMLSLRNEAGTTTSWLGSVMNGKYSARVWKDISLKNYFEISFSTKGYSNVTVSAAMGDDYNAYTTNWMQVSTDGENYETVATFTLPYRGWDEQEATLPESAWDQDKVYVRFYPDYTSDLVGVTSNNDGTAVADIFVLGDYAEADDDTAPVLVSSIPETGGEGISATGSIVLTFDEKVIAGEGNATLGDETLTGTFSGKTVVFSYSGLDYNTTYTFPLPAGVVTDRSGNAYEGCTISFTTMDRNQPEARLYDAVVAPDGSGDYLTVQEAIDAAPEGNAVPWLIFIKTGTYNEHVNIPATKSYLHLIGQSSDQVVITDNRTSGSGGYHVSVGATVVDNASNGFFEGISFENSWGVDNNAGPQALALYSVGDRIAFNKCKMRSYQDTWLTTTTANCRHYAKNCFIEGAVDFIYGQGNVYFDSCTINIVRTSGGFIVAPNHAAETTWGYVFMNNTITAPGVPSETSVWLGRPWHAYPKTVFINTTAEVTIPAAGWFDHMGGLPVLWADYNTMNADGSLQDLSYRRSEYWYVSGTDTIRGTAKNYLTDEEAASYTVKNVLSGDDTWQPTLLMEPCAAPEVTLDDSRITWDAVSYAMCYVIFKNDSVVGFTTDTAFDVDDKEAVWMVKAANEYGSLSDPGLAKSTDGVKTVGLNGKTPVSIRLYTVDGKRLQAPRRGVNIIRKEYADGRTETCKIIQ